MIGNEVVPSCKIALIEDNPADVLFFKEILKDSPDGSIFEFEAFSELRTALEALANNSFNLIVLDLGLLDSSGKETFEKVYHSFSHIPIVILSAFSDREIAVSCVLEGAQDFLIKGHFNPDDLTLKLRYALARHSQANLRKTQETMIDLVKRATGILGGLTEIYESSRQLAGEINATVAKTATTRRVDTGSDERASGGESSGK
jgi:two-component system, cell cycle response regulator